MVAVKLLDECNGKFLWGRAVGLGVKDDILIVLTAGSRTGTSFHTAPWG